MRSSTATLPVRRRSASTLSCRTTPAIFSPSTLDKAEWREDAKAFVQSCRELDVPVSLEISRSGNGAHAWIFFTTAVPARDARRLGTAIISHTCSRTRQLSLTSYDRLFPNQDTMPKGGFGNLIALPLQKKPRDAGHSVFVDDNLRIYPDQWAFLASVEPMSPHGYRSRDSACHRPHAPTRCHVYRRRGPRNALETSRPPTKQRLLNHYLSP